MPTIKVRDNEPFDIALRRFRRSCDKAGVITDVRKKEFYEKPTWVNKRMKAAAVVGCDGGVLPGDQIVQRQHGQPLAGIPAAIRIRIVAHEQ